MARRLPERPARSKKRAQTPAKAPEQPPVIAVSGQVLADALGLTPRRIRQLADEGIVIKLGHDRYDLVASLKNMRALEEGNSSDSEAKKRYLLAKADAQELETAQLRRELVKLSDVQRVYLEAMAIYSGECDAMAARLASELGAMTDPALIRERILTEERAARDSAGRRIRSLCPLPDAR